MYFYYKCILSCLLLLLYCNEYISITWSNDFNDKRPFLFISLQRMVRKSFKGKINNCFNLSSHVELLSPKRKNERRSNDGPSDATPRARTMASKYEGLRKDIGSLNWATFETVGGDLGCNRPLRSIRKPEWAKLGAIKASLIRMNPNTGVVLPGYEDNLDDDDKLKQR